MAQSLLNKIGVVLVSLLMILATGGYSVYRHYCQDENKTLTSLFTERLCEHDRLDGSYDCCNSLAEKPACCEAESNDSHSIFSGNEEECCQTSSIFLKINELYSQCFNPDILRYNVPAQTILTNPCKEDEPGHLFETMLSGSGISPPITGKERILHFRQLKISPDLA